MDRISSIEIKIKENEVIRRNKMQRHDLTGKTVVYSLFWKRANS